jgi:hypothetical protein
MNRDDEVRAKSFHMPFSAGVPSPPLQKKSCHVILEQIE